MFSGILVLKIISYLACLCMIRTSYLLQPLILIGVHRPGHDNGCPLKPVYLGL